MNHHYNPSPLSNSHDYNSTHYDHDFYHPHAIPTIVDRFLASAYEEKRSLDYSVISVVIFTLGMILAVEVLRHKLDAAASGNPYFHTVLELMYRERELNAAVSLMLGLWFCAEADAADQLFVYSYYCRFD